AEDDRLSTLPIENLLHLGAAFPAFVDHLVLIQARRGHRRDHIRHAHRILAVRTKWGLRKNLVLRDHDRPPYGTRAIPRGIPLMIKRVVVQCITLRKHLLLRVAAAGFDSLLNALPLDTCSMAKLSHSMTTGDRC